MFICIRPFLSPLICHKYEQLSAFIIIAEEWNKTFPTGATSLDWSAAQRIVEAEMGIAGGLT